MQSDNKYIELDGKLITASKISMLPPLELAQSNPTWATVYRLEQERQKVIALYLKGNLSEKARNHMLDSFEYYNNNLKQIFGL